VFGFFEEVLDRRVADAATGHVEDSGDGIIVSRLVDDPKIVKYNFDLNAVVKLEAA